MWGKLIDIRSNTFETINQKYHLDSRKCRRKSNVINFIPLASSRDNRQAYFKERFGFEVLQQANSCNWTSRSLNTNMKEL